MSGFVKAMPRPIVVLITGRRGSGKDVTAVVLAEAIHHQTGKLIYSHYNPEEFPLPKHWRERRWNHYQANTIQLIGDAHLSYFSRDWQQDLAKTLIKIISVTRHDDIDVIYTTQMTSLIDRQVIGNVDALIFKEPSAIAAKFERPELKELTANANIYFEGYNQTEKWSHAYAFTHLDEFSIIGIKMPDYYTEKMSKNMAGTQTGFWKKIL